ncbi:envelope protein [pteropodid alphaherpesvirus 2]|uniref:Envelope protein n=1 Tax=pteropodid alphaherpesvirus 2 TaxID=3118716 RepID=A0A510J718_9ALPH|nr:envelope protein [pteropodid alphaherpesvirus 2]BBM13192.1 envelope protein [pteropodid alphaherpesvirus 2]
MRGDLPLIDPLLVDETESSEDPEDLSIEEQFSLSSYGTSDFFVSSAYSRLPSHTQPVFSKRVFVFVLAFFILKPFQLASLCVYYHETGRLAALVCVATVVVGYYVLWGARALALYWNIKQDRLPLSPTAFWFLVVCFSGLALGALCAAAHETFAAEGLFNLISTGQVLPPADPQRVRLLTIACVTMVGLWVAAADSFAVAANFFLARFWTRAILNAPVAF